MANQNRPRLPAWFKTEDANFFRQYVTPELWEQIRGGYDHEALRAECEVKGIPLDQVRNYWYKSEHFSLFVKTEQARINTREIFRQIADELTDYQPPTFSFPTVSNQPKAAILNLYDAHLDKIALSAETGQDVTMRDNVERYTTAFDSLLASILQHDPELIVFPVGNDLFHANDFTGRTKKGTAIQYLASPEEAYSVICRVMIDCVHKLAATGAKVVIPFVKGNHDEDNITILGFWLEEVFGDVSQVEFLPGRLQRNYYRYGANLWGFAHGDKEKSKVQDLPLFMAEEAKEAWAVTKWRKFYCGDLHHKIERQFQKTKDRPGVEVHFLRSIGGPDKWHTDWGWIGIPKTGYAEIWDKEAGEVAAFRVNF